MSKFSSEIYFWNVFGNTFPEPNTFSKHMDNWILNLLLEVAKSLIEMFAEMIFVHGYIHGDAHLGNILVSPGGSNGFSLGVYLFI